MIEAQAAYSQKIYENFSNKPYKIINAPLLTNEEKQIITKLAQSFHQPIVTGKVKPEETTIQVNRSIFEYEE